MFAQQDDASADRKPQDEQDYLSSETAIMAGEDLLPTRPPVSWDPDVLQHLQRHLAYHIGPLARLLVARAAPHAPDLGSLCELLAAHISEARERALKAGAQRVVANSKFATDMPGLVQRMLSESGTLSTRDPGLEQHPDDGATGRARAHPTVGPLGD